MSAKVVLTPEEVEAIEKYRRYCSNSTDAISTYLTQSQIWTNEFKPLKEMGFEKFSRAYLLGYKKAPEPLKAGDIAMVIDPSPNGTKVPFKIDRVGKSFFDDEDTVYWGAGKSLPTYKIRRATDEEVKQYHAFASVQRQVGEFKIGDVKVRTIGDAYAINNQTGIETAQQQLKNGELKGFFPKESLKELQ